MVPLSFIYWVSHIVQRDFTPFLHHFFRSPYTIYTISAIRIKIPSFELSYSQELRVISYMHVGIHGHLKRSVSKKLLKRFGAYSAFYCARSISVAKYMHRYRLYSGFFTKLIKVRVIRAVLYRHPGTIA